jgi:hypothetical protein
MTNHLRRKIVRTETYEDQEGIFDCDVTFQEWEVAAYPGATHQEFVVRAKFMCLAALGRIAEANHLWVAEPVHYGNFLVVTKGGTTSCRMQLIVDEDQGPVWEVEEQIAKAERASWTDFT